MSGFVDAVGFLTRIPVRTRGGEVRLAAAVPWFPAVGAVVGVAAGVVYAAGAEVLPSLAAAAVAITAQVLLTGAFHEDGLADVADAAGGWSPDERMAILDDPRHGTYGVLALVATMVIRITALAAFGSGARAALAALVGAHLLARSSAVGVMLAVPPARPDGLGASYTAGISRRAAMAAVVVSGAVAVALLGRWGVVACCVVALVAVGAARYARRAFGGLTGDLLGATEQVGEMAVLLVAAATV